jgi:vacuolar-type H+-ATPase subunit F/Vma7
VTFAATFWYFPVERAIQAMRTAGVTHVMVHPSRFGHEADDVIRQLSARSDFELIAISRGIRLYRLH